MPPKTQDTPINKDADLKKTIEEVAGRLIRQELQGNLFTARKITDTPTDNLSVVNRKYVTNNGATGDRPVSPITGQFFFDLTLGLPIWFNGSNWVDAQGNVV
jgi:hypothetical protein